MSLTCDLNAQTDNLELLPTHAEAPAKADFCVLLSPLNGQCMVARPGEYGTAGWQTLYGPDSSDACWAWVHSKPRFGLRF